MKIKPNLFLNMSPQTTEEGGLAFARNMKLDDDGNLVSDYGYKDVTCVVSNDATPAVALNTYNIVGHIVGLDNKIYFFTSDNKIIEYDEVLETAIKLDTNWTYGGGEIDGYVNTNQSGEKILTIGEYLDNGSSIPLKHINLKEEINNGVKSWPFANVEQSLYSQAPKCPTANLVLKDTYVKTIPNGVYVFFIRYKIRKDVYTNWFLCSRPIFSGTSENMVTLQGGLKYINTHKDSTKSFIFQLNFAIDSNRNSYEEFQLGFIITHDEATDARIWKHFNMSQFVSGTPISSQNLIYFDYDDVQEANIDDLLETTYELYNVRNVTSFKNKLYISNYIETDFNPVLTDLISCISVGCVEEPSDPTTVQTQNQISITGVTLSPYTFDDNDIGYYPTVITQANLQNLLDFNISDFYKLESFELENAITLTLFGRSDEDPDIIYVNGLINNLYNKLIFGNDFTVAYNSNGNGWHDIGIETTPLSLGNTIHSISKYGNGHPLYDKMTFGYGIFGEVAIPSAYSTYAEANIIPINSSTIQASKAIAGASFMTDEIKSTVARLVEKDIKALDRFIIGYATITNGAKKYIVDLSTVGKNIFERKDYIGNLGTTNYGIENINNTADASITSAIKYAISKFISDNLKGVDDNGNLVIYYDNDYIKLNAVEFTFKSCEFKLDGENYINTNNDQIYNCTFNATLKTTTYNCFCTFNIKDSIITITPADVSADIYKQAATLMPFSKYKAYVHFVDKSNIITNGYPIDKIIDFPFANTINVPGELISDVSKFKLKYNVDNNVANYKGGFESFFISLENIGNIIIETFAPSYKDGYNIVNVLEADALLYNLNDNITIYAEDNSLLTDEGKYYSSGASTPSLAFGNCGYVSWEGDKNNKRAYIVIQRNTAKEEHNSLIKATPYIPLTSGNGTVSDGFYGSYFCSVKKPSFELSSGCYVSGNDIYSATRENIIKLKEFDGYINLQDSTLHFIRSNFNLNYLSLTEDIVDKIHRISSNIKDIKQPIKIINSAILSYIYELKPMYKDFTNKLFRKYDSDYKIDFDNTVRVSHVLSDETFNNSVFKFAATDYYNVPTDRGVIVNLFSIGNNIFVHTKSSFYKFDGNQTITSNNNDIQLQESEPFDTGITQIFDSEYGYGGIDTKQSGCITFDSYFFYDKSSNHIFAYGGNAQVQLIDGNVYKLLAYYKPSDCKTIHDELNCRVLFEFTSSRSEHSAATYKTFTLSYNYKTKTFVSLHDLSLVNAFAGRHRAYSYKNNGTINALLRLFEMEQVYTHQETVDEETVTIETAIDVTPLVPSMNINKIFGNATTACIIEFGASLYKKQVAPFGMAIVMFPRENLRETVNSIKYIADIQQKDPETQSSPVFDVLVNPQISRTNPVVNFYIVTDCCVSSVVNTNVNDNARPNTLLDYKGFKFDMGAWTSNYFRNDINKTDIYNYGQKYPNRDLDADQNSLVYGRYFIIIFDFKADTPVKFEELFMNTEKY